MPNLHLRYWLVPAILAALLLALAIERSRDPGGEPFILREHE